MQDIFLQETITYLTQLLRSNKIAFELFSDKTNGLLIPSLNIALVPQKIEIVKHPHIPNTKTVYLWEDEWRFKNHLLKSRLNSILGLNDRIHGRKTKVKRIDNDNATLFLNQHHINGSVKSKLKYGIFFEEELIGVATFSSAKNFTSSSGTPIKSYELIRFCTKSNTTVVGGLSKVLQAFIKERNPDEIMTYIDSNWSQGNSFLKFGFTLEKEMPAFNLYVNSNFERTNIPPTDLKGAIEVKNLKLKWFKTKA